MKKNQGYGICGMKNIYSSSSLLDNWVEDNFGRDLVAMNRSHKMDFNTEMTSTHINPAQMTRKCNLPEVKVESVETVKAKNKEGMPYSLLFGGDNITREDYKSTAQLSQVCNPENSRFAVPEQSLERVKSRTLMKERDSAFRKTTEYRSLNCRVAVAPRIRGSSSYCDDDVEDIPDFRRRKPVRVMGHKMTPKAPVVEDPVFEGSLQESRTLEEPSFASDE